MKPLFVLAAIQIVSVVATAFGDAVANYNFRKTTQYMVLSVKNREKLEQVDRDLDAIVDAIKKYAHDHGGTNPSSLDALVPEYLRKLPKDPFATASTAAKKPVHGYRQSLDGWGYQYKLDSQMFVHVASVGLPRFPYLRKQNYGLYRAVMQPSRYTDIPLIIGEEEEMPLGLDDHKSANK
ncbi:MAG: hypothetical protein ACYC4N_26860 [Pirellulaceae bacterium]